MPDPALLKRAVANNAAWCDAICRAHDVPGTFLEDVWLNPGTSPRDYPNVVTLAPTIAADRIAELLNRTSAPAPSVKDSFGLLDLTAARCELLFRADWLVQAKSSDPVADDEPVTWTSVTTAAELADWTAAGANDPQDQGTFPPGLLHGPEITFWAGRRGDALVAGGITFVNNGVVGLSNTFFKPEAESGLRSLVGAIAFVGGGMPIVGYEHGDALRAALAAGFECLGPLSVWTRA